MTETQVKLVVFEKDNKDLYHFEVTKNNPNNTVVVTYHEKNRPDRHCFEVPRDIAFELSIALRRVAEMVDEDNG